MENSVVHNTGNFRNNTIITTKVIVNQSFHFRMNLLFPKPEKCGAGSFYYSINLELISLAK